MTKQPPADRKKKSGPPRPDDFDLWAQVTASVTPLKSGGRRGESASPDVESEQQEATPVEGSRPASQPRNPRPVVQSVAAKEPREAPQLTGLDRRTSQKLTRGNAEIDGRLDLHGMTKQNARTALENFLVNARSAGARTVLVITGKGRSPYSSHTLHGYQQVDTPEREGVLRRALPQWLEETAFRVHVAGYQPAHPRHGGGGAFYIRLRKLKR